MELIRTSRQIGQAVKSVQRLRHVVAVFGKHGFSDVVQRMRLQKFLPPRLRAFAASQAGKSTALRFREALEELGPTFVKLGQVLSMRPDLLPEPFIEELVHLQDNVQKISYEAIKNEVERELGKNITSAFREFSRDPLASASIAQVHEAHLHTGEKVVVKVQRPDIQKIIDTDVSLLTFLARLLEKYVPETRLVRPTLIVDEFFKTISQELDFAIEANNIAKITENLSSLPQIVIPKVYKTLSTHKILTLEKLEGLRVDDTKRLDAMGINRKEVVQVGARAFFQSVMIDGLFHGDLHSGNLFVLPGNRLGIIDFGIVGRLSQKSRDQLATMVLALLSEDYEKLCYEYIELGSMETSVDLDGFQRELRNALSPYMGLPIAEINAGRVLIEATKIAAKYQIQVPGDWMIVFKAILTIEAMGRALDPDFDLLAIGQELAKDLVKNQYSVQRLSKDALWVAKDLSVLLQFLPRQIRWMFKKLSRNDFALEFRSPELERLARQVERGSKRNAASIAGAGFLVAAALSLPVSSEYTFFGYPVISVILCGLGLLAFWRGSR